MDAIQGMIDQNRHVMLTCKLELCAKRERITHIYKVKIYCRNGDVSKIGSW